MFNKTISTSRIEHITNILCDSIKLPESNKCFSSRIIFFKDMDEFISLAKVCIQLQQSSLSFKQHHFILKKATSLKVDFIKSLYFHKASFKSFPHLLLSLDVFFKLKFIQKPSSDKQLFELITIHFAYMLSILISESIGLKSNSEQQINLKQFYSIFQDNFSVLTSTLTSILNSILLLDNALFRSDESQLDFKLKTILKLFYGIITLTNDLGCLKPGDIDFNHFLHKFSSMDKNYLSSYSSECASLAIVIKLSIFHSILKSQNLIDFNSVVQSLNQTLSFLTWDSIFDLKLNYHIRDLFLSTWVNMLFPATDFLSINIKSYKCLFRKVHYSIVNYFSRQNISFNDNVKINQQLIFKGVLRPLFQRKVRSFKEQDPDFHYLKMPYTLLLKDPMFLPITMPSTPLKLSSEIKKIISRDHLTDTQFDLFLNAWRYRLC